MGQTHVLVLDDGKLLSEGVVHLLQARSTIELRRLDLHDADALNAARRAQVIVVPSYKGSEALPEIARLLAEIPGVRIVSIALGSERTEMNIYRSERFLEVSLQDLLVAIERDSEADKDGAGTGTGPQGEGQTGIDR